MKAITQEQYDQAPRAREPGGAKPEGGYHLITYRLINGTAYHEATPLDVAQALESLRASQAMTRIFLGDPETGQDWNEECDVVGRIGRSTGRIKIPLLVPRHEDGGPGLLDHCIVRLVQVGSGQELQRHPRYHCRNFGIQDETCLERPELRATVYRDGEEVARFESPREAAHWIRFMRGEVRRAFDPRAQGAKRAERARQLLARHALPEDESIVELLADLRHYCRQQRLDFGAAVEAANRQFNTQLQGIYP